MRILGLDYGGKQIGVAVSDPFGWSAQGLCVIIKKDEHEYKSVVVRVKELLSEYDIKTIVLGYPKNMDNSESQNGKRVLKFKKQLETSIKGIEVLLQDERLSTVSAMRVLDEAKLNYKKKNIIIDKQAAVVILQAYLDFNNQKEKIKMVNDEIEDDDDFDEDEIEIVTLTGDDGEEIDCQILESLEFEGVEYLLVVEMLDEDEEEDDEDDDLIPFILKSVGENDDDMMFESITDENEYNKVVTLFNELSDDYDLQ